MKYDNKLLELYLEYSILRLGRKFTTQIEN